MKSPREWDSMLWRAWDNHLDSGYFDDDDYNWKDPTTKGGRLNLLLVLLGKLFGDGDF